MLKSDCLRYCLLFLSLGLSLESIGQNLPTENRIKLGSTINTSGDEGGSIISRDGNLLVFIRGVAVKAKVKDSQEAEQQDIFTSTRNADGTWAQAVSVGAPVNSEDEDNTCAGIGVDNNTLYMINLIRTKRSLNRGVSVSKNAGGAWGMPQPLSLPVKIPAIGFFSAYVSPDESVVIISAALQGSKGEEDLFVCTKKADGTWNDLVHMGDAINSAGYETTPFLSPDGKTLFFSSNGFGGLGDADIFRSQRSGDSWTSWSAPENLGPKINTAGFDASFSVDANNNAYFTSGEGAKSGPGDIYGMNVSTLLPPPASATPAVDSTEIKAAAMKAAQEKAAMEAQAAAEAKEKEEKEKALAANGGKNTEGKAGTNPNGDDGQDSVYTGNLMKAYFETSSAVLSDEYRDEIVKAVKSVLKGRTAYVTVYGFADNSGNPKKNMALSKRRASAVKNALVKAGVKSTRVKAKGFGDANPAADNSTAEGRKMNRRVEIHMSH